MTARDHVCQKSSFAEHSREEGVSLFGRQGGNGGGHSPFQAVCGGIRWPLALPSCRASQEEETSPVGVNLCLLPGCDGRAGPLQMCVSRSAGPGQPLIWPENVG